MTSKKRRSGAWLGDQAEITPGASGHPPGDLQHSPQLNGIAERGEMELGHLRASNPKSLGILSLVCRSCQKSALWSRGRGTGGGLLTFTGDYPDTSVATQPRLKFCSTLIHEVIFLNWGIHTYARLI